MDELGDIGLIGLAVMGKNLALNFVDHGYRVAVFNRTESKTRDFLSETKSDKIIPTYSIEEFQSKLKVSKKILLMVKAGEVVDDYINQLLPFLKDGDIIIDGGNSYFEDSERRFNYLKEKGIRFVGLGISGGEEGARNGPSLMPGGDVSAWLELKPMLQKIAAKTDDGEICCDWIGEGGSGHFVKMVHNGIEYADMQLIAESYDLLKSLLHYSPPQLSEVYSQWNKGELKSYLIEITSKIFLKENMGRYVVDHILDKAKQKGTGQWTIIEALKIGVVSSVIAEAVFARNLSFLKEEREIAKRSFTGPERIFSGRDEEYFVKELRQAVYASKIICYAQGFSLLQQMSINRKWKINLSMVAKLWKNGCIIRSVFLNQVAKAFDKDVKLNNLLMDPFFRNEILQCQGGWRSVVTQATISGIPIPCLGSALYYFDGYRSASLPANLIQAQRDFFGSHGYEKREDRNNSYHMDWLGNRGEKII